MAGKIWRVFAAVVMGAGVHAARTSELEIPPPGPAAAPQLSLRNTSFLDITARVPAEPLAAQQEFCQMHAGDCRDGLRAARIELTASVWRTMVAVNRAVNAAVQPVTDLEKRHQEDRWDYPDDGTGDCEDYQLEKMRRLGAAGFPDSAMRMVVVVTELGEGHAVLAIRTDQSDFILDNRTDFVRDPVGTPYTFLKMIAPESDHRWVAITGLPDRAPDREPVVNIDADLMARLNGRPGPERRADAGLPGPGPGLRR